MRELQFMINDVREQTDNRDVNGIKDKEIVRYFNDGIKTIQAMIFKNNPLCSYYQKPKEYAPLLSSREYALPDDCYAENAVSLVSMYNNNGYSNDYWTPVDRVWPEDGGAFFGWFTRNKTLYFSGDKDRTLTQKIQVWYFNRLPRFDKAWATVVSKAGQVITIGNIDTEMFTIDRYISILSSVDGSVKVAGLSYKKTTATTITVVGDLTNVAADDFVVMGKFTLMTLEMPEECEPYLMDYVAQRIASRNVYTEDFKNLNYWTSEERSNIIAIFADASQAEVRAPITDTEYMRI